VSSPDPSLALQAALVTALKSATAAGTSVFDRVPTSDPFPRITVGNGQSVPANEEADPSCGYDPTDSFLQIDVWSRAVGKPEVKGIASAVRSLLHEQSLALTGHVMELPMTVSSVVYERDPDGLTERARMTVEVRTVPST
jgi:hypothetical protein